MPHRFSYAVKLSESPYALCALAFRASIVVLKSERFTQHQNYNMFHGSSRFGCILWWIFPEDGRNHDKSERKFKMECTLPKKPSRESIREDDYKRKLREYTLEVKKVKERHVKLQAQSGTGFDRPAKPKFKKATAIFFPITFYHIEPYKPSEFEKNYRGKVMLTEKSSIIGVGRVDRIIRASEAFHPLTNQGNYHPFSYYQITDGARSVEYQEQYQTVVEQASELFALPTEQKQLELFLDHVRNNEHAKKCIQRLHDSSNYWS